jgi:ParB family chromosome partitioning protein
MSNFHDIDIPLASITRLSPLNPRQDMESDVASLAATIRARGLLQPILVRKIKGQPKLYEVLDGGRRWRALHMLHADDGDVVPVVTARLFDGSDSEAREAAIAVSVTQKPLHPVDEYEAFAALEAGGMTIADIARDFAQSEKQVNQRLALGRLSPRVLALWREGEIDREQSQAFTLGGIPAQEAVLDSDSWAKTGLRQVYSIRKALRSTALESYSAVARFLRADPARIRAYLEAGGRIESNLFEIEDGETLLDGPLAESIANRLLLTEAEKVMDAEGWGGAAIASDDDDPDTIVQDPDVTPAEQERLDQIDKERFGASEETRAALEAEEDAINTRAILRTVRESDRKSLAVRAEIDGLGNLYFVRAVPMQGAERDDLAEDDEHAPPARDPKPRQPEPPPPPAPAETIGKQARAVLDAGVTAALQEATLASPNLALVFAVAALGCQYGRECVNLTGEITSVPRGSHHRSGLLREIAAQKFDRALATCLATEYSALANAFAELVAGAIDTTKSEWSAALPLLAAAARKPGMAELLRAGFDYKEYFLSAGKEASLVVIRELDGETAAIEAARLKKSDLAALVATLAAHREWLPDELLAAIGKPKPPEPVKKKDKRSTAQAMDEAIDDDEARKQAVARFVATRDFPPEGIKASLLYGAFVAWAEREKVAPMSVIAFATAMQANGVAKKRGNTGVHYLGPQKAEAAQ